MLAVALVLALLAPASSSAAPGDTCPPGTALTPAYEFVEVGEKAPLVATHELSIVALAEQFVSGSSGSPPGMSGLPWIQFAVTARLALTGTISVIRGPRMFGPAIAATSDGVWSAAPISTPAVRQTRP